MQNIHPYSRDSSDWRFNDQQDHGHRGGVGLGDRGAGGGDRDRGGGNQKIIPPRFQRSRATGMDDIIGTFF